MNRRLYTKQVLRPALKALRCAPKGGPAKSNTLHGSCLCNTGLSQSAARNRRHYSSLSKLSPLLLTPTRHVLTSNQRRTIIIMRLLRAATKIRYLVLGAAGAAGVSGKMVSSFGEVVQSQV